MSVAAAARETQLKSRGSLIYAIVNKGAFAAAAVRKFWLKLIKLKFNELKYTFKAFCFLACVVYLVFIILFAFEAFKRKRNKTRNTNNTNENVNNGSSSKGPSFSTAFNKQSFGRDAPVQQQSTHSVDSTDRNMSEVI